MVNKVILVGHLGKDPEVKHLDQNRVVANLTLATSERYTDRNGNKVENTEWHRLEMWDGLAKVAEKYLAKGSLIYVEGKIKTGEWEKDGVKRYTTKIRVNTMNMLGKSSGGSSQSTPAADTGSATDSGNSTDGDDDLPF